MRQGQKPGWVRHARHKANSLYSYEQWVEMRFPSGGLEEYFFLDLEHDIMRWFLRKEFTNGKASLSRRLDFRNWEPT